ncbi:MAG: carboxylesterase family protein, partial [Candidatus Binataceae bacterium]
PYAAPPAGDLRWQSPKPHASWPGELDATRTRSWCPQTADFPDPRVVGSEDCLYLNIYTPDPAGTELPVMVWVHGGTFIVGSGAPSNGSNLARKGNLIVVTINYRLGALGFLAHRSLDSSDSRHVSGNYGLMDQQEALRWVRDNIAAFGGDPGKVTIAGQSAGAISAGLQMVSPEAAGLFQRAILESGPFPRVQTLKEAEVRGNELATKLGCDKVPDTAGCMRSKTIEQIVSAIPADPMTSGNLVWSPIVDGHVVPSQPAEAIAAGRINRVSVINGSNRDEGTIMRAAAKPITAERFERGVHSLFGKDAARVMAAYPLANYSSPTLAAAAAYGDATFSCRIIKTGSMLSALEPVYQYEFNDTHAPLTFFRNPPFPLGAFHSSEIQYVFGDIAANAAASPAQKQLCDAMMGYWIGFITSGDPAGSPRWNRYRADDPHVLSLAPGAIGNESNFAKIHHCDLWDSIQF